MFLRVHYDRIEVVARLVEVTQPLDKPCVCLMGGGMNKKQNVFEPARMYIVHSVDNNYCKADRRQLYCMIVNNVMGNGRQR